MRKHWRLSMVCLVLVGALSACGSGPMADSARPKASADVTSTEADSGGEDPSAGEGPTRAPTLRPKPSREQAIEALDAWGAKGLMASTETEDLSKESDFGKVTDLLPDEADSIATQLDRDKDELYVLTNSRAKVVFHYNPQNELEVLSSEAGQ